MLRIEAGRALLSIVRGTDVIKQYPIRTSRYGLGEVENSGQTPRGWLTITEKIGDHEPLYTLFKSRVPVGVVPKSERSSPSSYIVSRILRLSGLQSGFNQGYRQEARDHKPVLVDTYERMIYIHGVTGPIKLPKNINLQKKVPAGCIVMKPKDIVDLFDRIPVGTPVLVLP